jgi:hypothetical protein
MFEYTIRVEGSTTWACVTDDAYYIEVNATGITDEQVIQNKIQTAIENLDD